MKPRLARNQPQPFARTGSWLFRWLLLVLLAAFLTGSAHEQAGGAFQGGSPSTPDKKAPAAPPQPAARGLESFKLPTDAIVLVCEQVTDAMRLLPKFVVLSPEKFKEMQDEIDRLRARLRPDRPQPPGFCKIEGKVEGAQVHLDVTYDVRTERPETVVALGCKQAKMSGLPPDNANPLVKYTETDGYTVQIEKAGTHRLTYRYVMGLSVLGSTRSSLELDLPRSAGSTLKLHVPGEVKELRINDQPLDKTLTWKNGVLEGPGVPDRLVLTWKGSTALAGGSTVLSAESKIKVQIEKQRLHTEAQLQLKVVGGSTRRFCLLVPPGAQLTLASADEEKLTVETQELAGASLRILRLKEATTAPLTVTVVAPVRSALPKAGTRLAIGPFALLGATRQTGTIVLVNNAPHLQVQPHRPAVTTPRAPTSEETKLGPQVRAFSYELPPLSETPPFLDKGGDPATLNLLELEGETTRGRLETRVSHSLHLPRKEAAGEKRFWQIATTLEVKLLQPGAGLLEVQLPADWVFVPPEGRLPDPVTEIHLDEPRQVIQVRLLPDSWKPFQLVLRARSSRPVDDSDEDRLSLPRPLGTALVGGFLVTATVPEELELLPPQRSNTHLELTQPQQSPQEQTWRLDPTADRTPEQIELAWGPYRPRVWAKSVIDLELIGPRAQIQQELRLLYPRTPADKTKIALRVPAEVRLGVIEGGTLLPDLSGRPSGPPGASTRQVELALPERNRPQQEVKLVLRYFLKLPDPAEAQAGLPAGAHAGVRPDDPPVKLGLVTAQDSTCGETWVRLWSAPGLLPGLADDDWAIKEIQEVKGNPRLPFLVLLSQKPEGELTLRLAGSGTASKITVLIERALVRVQVVEGIGQFYRASYRLARLNSGRIDVELPAPAATLHLRIRLDGKEVTPQIHDDPDIPEGEGRLARLTLDSLVKPDSILDISYQLPPAGLTGRGGLLQTVLLPPIVRGAPHRVLTRWQVHVPGGWVVLGPEGGPGSERTWGRRGLLLASRLAITASDLDRWLVGPDGVLPANRDLTGEEADWPTTPSLTCWRGGPEPLAVVHLPQQAWLLFCSLFVLLLGLLVGFLARGSAKEALSPIRIGLALALLGLVTVVTGVFWPGLLALILYGCQPGLVVLVLIVLGQWLLHERRRRQLVFLPSFSRRGGSSLNQGHKTASSRRGANGLAPPPANPAASGSGRPGARSSEQPSTIDEPRPV